MPPFSVLDTRSGAWQDKKRTWAARGINSRAGREGSLAFGHAAATDEVSLKLAAMSGGTSIFDPVLCELILRWWSQPGDKVIDPFAGGSVRGIVSGFLDREYVGTEIRREQVDENYLQLDECKGVGVKPVWVHDDGLNLNRHIGHPSDLLIGCPPYGDLEVYSDLDGDLSNMGADRFDEVYAQIIASAAALLAPDRFAVFVVGDYRDTSGYMTSFVSRTINHFACAGMRLYNEGVLVNSVGTGALRAGGNMTYRKLTKCHQNVLVFCNGDVKRSARRLAPVDYLHSALPDPDDGVQVALF